MRAIDPAYYEHLYKTLKILPGKRGECIIAAQKVMRGEARYKNAGALCGAPWEVIGIIHLMESGCSWNRQIVNGEHWNIKTRLYPPGLGPWDSWEDAAVAGMLRFRKRYPAVWSIGTMGLFLERWNGMGYATRGKNSPYLWSMSNHGEGVGKFVADGKYDPLAISDQVGAMVALRLIREGENERAVIAAGSAPMLPMRVVEVARRQSYMQGPGSNS